MPYGDTLFQRLRLAERPDLLDLLSDVKKDAPRYSNATNEDLVTAISAELRSAAGNSFVNVTRETHEFPYKQILIDVADKLAPGRFAWTEFKLDGPETEEHIERFIYERVQVLVQKHLEGMNESDKAKLQERVEADLRARGVSADVIRSGIAGLGTAAVVGLVSGPIVATAMFSGAWTWLIGLPLRQLALGGIVAGGPAGVLVAIVLAAAGTGYSKTIPAVIRLIAIKLSHDEKAALSASA